MRAAIVEAVDRLSPMSGPLLRTAAVLGGPFDLQDLAVIAGEPSEATRAVLRGALADGLMTVDGEDRFSFSHDLIREVLAGLLPAARLPEIHARAADRFLRAGPSSADLVGRGAHHAVRAAALSPARARSAVAACRDAATTMTRGYAYERAAALLAAAVEIHERAELDEPFASLLLEWADAMLRCGRLTEARQGYDRAALWAQTEADVESLARAALGLGGVWINEHRTSLEWQRVVSLQRRALADLPPEDERLRHRLVTRLAAEAVYRGGPVGPVLKATDEARRLGDPLVLGEASSLCHHVLLTAEHTHARLTLADELIAVASSAGEDLLALIGLCWRTVDLFHLGDPHANRSLAELRQHTEMLGCKSILYIVEAMTVMLSIRAGRLDDAEAQAVDCFALGSEVGDADAVGYLGAHLGTIRWLQCRDAELLEMLEQVTGSVTLNPAEFGFEASAASIAARTGAHEPARYHLDRIAAKGLRSLPQSSTWLYGMLAIVEAARVLGDVALAREAYDLLLPFADLPVMPSLAVTCFGSTHRALGLAMLAIGDIGRAVAHLDQAVPATRLLGNRPVTAITMADLAEALLRRGGPGDRERAVRLLTDARASAGELGMTVWAAEWTRRLDEAHSRDGRITRQRRHWSFALGDERTVIDDRIGVRYLTQLLTSPGRAISALELAGGPEAKALAAQRAQPVLDQAARAAYRRRVEELTDRINAADVAGDDAAASRHRAELAALLDHLRQVTGRGGHLRGFPDPGERARTAVRKAIKRAVDEITLAAPALGRHLAESITTGATCCYAPGPADATRWTLTTDR